MRLISLRDDFYMGFWYYEGFRLEDGFDYFWSLLSGEGDFLNCPWYGGYKLFWLYYLGFEDDRSSLTRSVEDDFG